MTTDTAAGRPQRHFHLNMQALSIFVAAAAIFVIFGFLNSNFLTVGNLRDIAVSACVNALIGIGLTFVIITGGIDLSVGSIASFVGIVSANLMVNSGVGAVPALLVGLVLGFVAGGLNGVLITLIKLPPFIVTLGTLSIFTAIGLLYSGGSSISVGQMPLIMNTMGFSFTIGQFTVTFGVIAVVVLALIVAYALSQTAWGRHVYAVGDDIEAARLAGIQVNRVLLSVYTVAGLIYGFTAWILIGRAGTASPNAIVGANLETITANGFPSDKVRIVTENARTLKLDQFGFEAE